VVTIGVKKSSKHRDTRSSFKDDVLIKSMVQAGAKLGKKLPGAQHVTPQIFGNLETNKIY
jgi:hypothetical protein